MTIKRKYALGYDFPYEGFVQAAIEKHFRELGFTVDADSHIDLVCSHPNTPTRWHIEAKGKTAEPGLDFRTCLGQLVQRIRERDTCYAIAPPDIPPYVALIDSVSAWVVDALNIHWLLVSPDGSVHVRNPHNNGRVDA